MRKQTLSVWFNSRMSSGCCGLYEIYGFNQSARASPPLPAGVAIIATTISTQKKAIEYLEAHGFKKTRVFKNEGSGNKVTVWFRKPI